MNFRLIRPLIGLIFGLVLVSAASEQPRDSSPKTMTEAKVDRVFERWNRSDTPGCVVGVAVDGKPVLVRAYGMANLEYGIRLRRDTMFESGSMAKQFTAAAIALLVQDGKLSLDDPAKKNIHELPDFGTPILIRHLLNHTSGLRSQWPLLTLSGRPRGHAAHTVDEILELVGRMKELNFQPGDEYLYCNTGYTLLGVIIERVSGKSLADFSRERLFEPLGMKRTQWCDDFTEIVPDRATAYGMKNDGAFYTNMPFTDVVGNGGLLTTADDLLIGNENLDKPRVGGQKLVAQLETRGRLNDGTEIKYAQGLFVKTYKGLREVSHAGSTAGYHTFLARFPEERLSIVVLSNVAASDPPRLAHEVADIFLAGEIEEPAKPIAVDLPTAVLNRYVGVYREPLTDAALRVEFDQDGKSLRIGGRMFIATSAIAFTKADGTRQVVFEADSAGSSVGMRDSNGQSKTRLWKRVPPFSPGEADLAAFTVTYYSEEIDTVYRVWAEGGKLKVLFRPAQRLEIMPIYEDAFSDGSNIFQFTRDDAGRVDGFLVYAGRVRHLKFIRTD